MKKKIILLTLMLVILIPGIASAQSLVGTWVCNDKAVLGIPETENTAFEFVLTFNPDGTAAMRFNVEVNQEEDGMVLELGLTCSNDGAYEKSGNKLDLSFDQKNAKMDVTKMDIQMSAEMESALAAMGMTKQSLIDMTKKSISPKDLGVNFDDMSGTMTIERLTATDLVLTEGNTTVTFVRQ